MSHTTTKTIEVEVPELGDLAIETGAAERLNSLCLAVRSVQTQIAGLEKTKKTVMEDLKPMAESLGLPERVLGVGWDLRRTVRATETINAARLRVILMQRGFSLPHADEIVDLATDRSESVSWSVYGRKEEKKKEEVKL